MSEKEKCPIRNCNEFRDCRLSVREGETVVVVDCVDSGGRYRFAKDDYAKISELGESAFDTRQFNHLAWEKDKLPDFRKALQFRIERAIGRGPKTAEVNQDGKKE